MGTERLWGSQPDESPTFHHCPGHCRHCFPHHGFPACLWAPASWPAGLKGNEPTCTPVPKSCVLCISCFAQCCPHSFLTFSGLMLSLGATQRHHFGCSRAVAESCYQTHSSRAWGKSLGVCLASSQWSPRARRCQIKPPVSDFSPSVCPMHPQQQLWAVQSQAIAPNKFLWTPTCRATAAVSQSCLNMVLIWLDIFNAPTCLKLEEI